VSITAELDEHGWCLTSAADLGWPGPQAVLDAFGSALAPDPRAPGKMHARDVITYRAGSLAEASSAAFTTEAGQVIDDFSRFRLLDQEFGWFAAAAVLGLIPPEHRRESGTLTADLFRYEAGIESAAHRDGFGEYVVIWVLARSGSGGESFLLRDGREVFSRALEPGEVLIFRDELFQHGARAMRGSGASRDVLIFITLKDLP
jgi:hypothetical protein